MRTTNDVHQQFASFFKSETLQPFAYLVSKKLSEGHICLPLDDAGVLNEELPAHYKGFIEKKERLKNEPLVGSEPGERQPFILYNNCLYLQRYFAYESLVLERIRDFGKTEEERLTERMERLYPLADFIRDLFTPKQTSVPAANSRTDWQMVAALNAVLNNLTIITGGPGTGKTSTVARILAILYQMNPALRVALAAPTGKAAARMGESLKSASVKPSTIHRLLGFVPDSTYFEHHRSNPLNYDVVIVDEASMIDVSLFAKLLDAIGQDTRLILLGDKDQLASVEAGSLFGDLCQAQGKLNLFSRERATLINSLIADPSRAIDEGSVTSGSGHPLFQHIIELRHSHRFSGDEGIGRFSKAIITKDKQTLNDFIVSADAQVLVDTAYSRALFEEFSDGYAEFIREKDIQAALQKMNRLRVLCAVREGEHGVYQVNRRIEKYLQQKKLIRANGGFYENRPVIVTGNNYTVGLYNGDTGIVRPDEKGTLKVWFEDGAEGIKSVIPGYISQAETVFAMTIHKSQGSEFDRVLIVLPDSESNAILTSELLYTAVTRARSKVFLLGSASVILQASDRFVKRASGIAGRFSDY